MKKMMLGILTSIMFACAFLPVYAEEPTATPAAEENTETTSNTEGGPAISAPSAVLIDSASGTILYQKNMNETHNQASLTKIMTVYLACENLKSDSYLTMSEDVFNSFDRNTNHLWIVNEESLQVKDLEYGAMLSSANDCASMLAAGVSGTLDAFVQKMNDTAASLNMKDTVFADATGLHSDQSSTPYDMAVLTRAALKNDTFAQVFKTVSYEIPADGYQDARQIATDNEQLKQGEYAYQFVSGGKIGNSDAGGFAMSASADNGSMTLVAVVMGEADDASSYNDTKALFEYGFSSYRQLSIDASSIGSKTVDIYEGKKLKATAVFTIDTGFNALVPSSVEDSSMKTDIVVENENDPETIEAYVVFYLDGTEVGRSKMNKDITEYDISFNATTLPTIMQYFDYFCIGVLALFVFGKLLLQIGRHFMPPQ